ncbi:MAG TPA: hypothetical protein VKU01_33880 [Bryobacteraceae bacterium]|nr:hypothetical protein [Bryobacteraceae bacterium]
MTKLLSLILVGCSFGFAQSWPQWGQNPQHSGQVSVVGQRAGEQLAEITYDPLVPKEQADDGGELLAHYQAPLTDGNDLFMEFKAGTWVACNSGASPCGADAWNSEIWGEKRYQWQHGKLVEQWSFQSDWKPEPSAGGLGGWEPVFHAALAGNYVYVPGAAGSVYKLNRGDGSVAQHVQPFSGSGGAANNVFVAGPLVADSAGNIYYNAIGLNLNGSPWSTDVAGAWLVKVTPNDHSTMATFTALTAGAPGAGSGCLGTFSSSQLPWPPSPDAVPPSGPCGSQRPGINIAPAIGQDGTIYTISRAHFSSRYAYLIAANPDLSPKWSASLRDRLNDGCGSSILPANGQPGGCRNGARAGVEPSTNQLPAGQVIDQSSSSPVVAPDGSILYGSYTDYNYQRGHLFHFSPSGTFLNAFDFGWDVTPAVYAHDGTYSVIVKDNHYDTGSYCFVVQFCPTAPEGPYYITQLSSDLAPEWKFQSTNNLSCSSNSNGTVSCVSDHPGGFEWCINAPAVDSAGKVYANSEDGHLYVITQGGALESSLFLNLAIGAAYTPLSLGPDGKIYTQNDGKLFVVGKPDVRKR